MHAASVPSRLAAFNPDCTMNRMPRFVHAVLPLAVAGLVSVFPVQVALAQSGAAKPPAKSSAKSSKPREASLGGGSASGPVMTKDELRQCLAEQDRLKQETADVVATQKKLAADRAEIDRTSAALDADRPNVDVSNKEAVDAFNARLQAKGKLVADYQAAAPAFNQRVDKLDADDKAFTKNCRDRRYFEDEYDEIKAGK